MPFVPAYDGPRAPAVGHIIQPEGTLDLICRSIQIRHRSGGGANPVAQSIIGEHPVVNPRHLVGVREKMMQKNKIGLAVPERGYDQRMMPQTQIPFQ